jgi:hypothetical protein
MDSWVGLQESLPGCDLLVGLYRWFITWHFPSFPSTSHVHPSRGIQLLAPSLSAFGIMDGGHLGGEGEFVYVAWGLGLMTGFVVLRRMGSHLRMTNGG